MIPVVTFFWIGWLIVWYVGFFDVKRSRERDTKLSRLIRLCFSAAIFVFLSPADLLASL